MDQGQLEAARTLGFEIRNPQRFAHNMARLAEETGKAATVFLQPHAIQPTHVTLHDDFAPALRTFAQLQRAWLRQPYKVFEAQVALWNSWSDLWHSSVCRFMGLQNGEVGPGNISAPQDLRFQHPAWSEHPYFDFLKQGGFKWSSQHGLCELFGGTGPEPRPVFSSPGSFAACC